MRTMRHDTTRRTRLTSRTRLRTTALAIGLGLVLAACAGESAAPGTGTTGGYGGSSTMGAPAPSEGPSEPTVTAGAIVTVTNDAKLGTILTDDQGMTLYLFTTDSPGVSTCVDGCLAAWPALLTDGEPTAQGSADAALLGTLTRDDGTVQVTYAGWPLYYFASDMGAGDVTGQGINDVWFVVAPDGTAVGDEPEAADTGGGMGESPASDGGYSYVY